MKKQHYISHKTMLNILNDLSPFKYIYLYGFGLVFFTPLMFGNYFSDFAGITPFAQSMELASGRIRLLNDLTVLYFIMIFIVITAAYFFKGLSFEIVREFKLAARNSNKLNHEVGENPKRSIFITASLLIAINLGWVWFFGFTSAGNSKVMRSYLEGTETFIIIAISLGFLANFYLLIYALLMMEGRKHVIFQGNH